MSFELITFYFNFITHNCTIINCSKKDESLVSESTDWRSSSEVKKRYDRNRCKMLLTGNKYNRPVFPRELPGHAPINLTDQVCKTNKSLALIAVDSIRYGYFAESLGIDISKKKDKTAVVIVDSTVRFNVFN